MTVPATAITTLTAVRVESHLKRALTSIHAG